MELHVWNKYIYKTIKVLEVLEQKQLFIIMSYSLLNGKKQWQSFEISYNYFYFEISASFF